MQKGDALGLDLPSRWMNAAGSLGFAPEGELPKPLGLFVTNPISLAPRRAAEAAQTLEFPGGALLHSGLPNPGLSAVLKQYAKAWARASQPVIVHLLAHNAADLRRMVLRLEGGENVLALEVGLPADASLALVSALGQAAQGELAWIAQLPTGRALELGEAALQAGAAALSLGPLRGSLAGRDGNWVSGRLYGPAVLPQALEATRQLVKLGAPVLAAGGVNTPAAGEQLLAAGAAAVQVDIGLWSAGGFAAG